MHHPDLDLMTLTKSGLTDNEFVTKKNTLNIMIVWHPNCRILLHLFPLSSAMLAYFHSHSRKNIYQNHHFPERNYFVVYTIFPPKFGEPTGTVIIK